MFKNLSNTTKLFGGLIIAVIVIMVIVISISGNKTQAPVTAHYVSDTASADNKVEALKTVTANLLAVENKNKQLQQTIQDTQKQNQAAIDDLKKSVTQQVNEAVKKLQVDRAEQKQSSDAVLKRYSPSSQSYPIAGQTNTSPTDGMVWVSDVSDNQVTKSNASKAKDSPGLLSPIQSLLHTDVGSATNPDENQTEVSAVKPMYTIPVNATLTGATLMTPLVGRVPIDGQLPSPYNFKLVLSSENLTANGYPLPGVKGAVMSGVASGDMLGSCARGDIHSITFIFDDGTISTTEATSDTDALGYISTQNGNPCINGEFHSNAAIFLSAQMGLAGMQGYANALSSAQYSNTMTTEGTSMSALMGSANKAAAGQGLSAASVAAQNWWNQRVKNSFDYVYVSNVNAQTGQPMKVVANITKAISIDYDNKARKVNYADELQTTPAQLD